MIALDLTTRSIQVVLSGAKATADGSFVATYVDEPASPTAVGIPVVSTAVGTTNGVTAVTLVPAPGGTGTPYRRRVKSINLFNADSAPITLTVQINDTAGSVVTKFQQITLQTLEMLNYEEGYGFETLDVNGATKSQNATTSSATSTAQSIAVLGSSQASSMAALTPASVSSQASSAAALTPASVSSQASSTAALSPASVSSNASLGSLGSSQASSLLTRWSVTISKTSSSFSF